MWFKIKVCGITRTPDALTACKYNVDMLGFIFYKNSPRYITVAGARAIAQSLPPLVARVGVFVDEKYDKIMKVAEFVKLDWVQLSGGESTRMIKKLQQSRLRVIKVFDPVMKGVMAKAKTSPADLIMFDNKVRGVMGGTGRTFDWGIKGLASIGNLMLAGGIDIDNVADGVATFKPAVIDVNSGVESSPGIKSKRKLSLFLSKCDRMRYGR
jgi:phosphoribosylanthranilate isomerase